MNNDLEQAVLSILLFHNDNVEQINKNWFFNDLHKVIFDKITEFKKQHKPILPELLFNKITEKKYFDYVCGLYSLETSKTCLTDYLLALERNYTEKAFNDAVEALKSIYDINEKCQALEKISSDFYKTENKQEDALQELQQRIKNGGVICGLKTGFDELDDAINGLQNGCLYVIGARSSMGKTAFMASIIANMTVKVGVLSLEMTTNQMFKRLWAIKLNIPYWKLDRGHKDCEQQFNQIASLHNELKKQIIVDDEGGINNNQLVYKIKYLAKQGCKCIFVDHIGLVKQDDSKNNLAYTIGKTTATLKALSKQLNIPIVILCQLNRNAVKEKPSLVDLRDSGRIEEDADCVILLNRKDYFNQTDCNITDAEYNVAKCRNGKTGCFTGHFIKDVIKYT